MTNIQKLIDIGSSSLGSRDAAIGALSTSLGLAPTSGLAALLTAKNGLYAFEGALHVFPSESVALEYGLVAWNEPGLWRSAYEGMADRGVFFAEDVFGNQFSIDGDGRISSFDAETGAYEANASSLEEWAGRVLDDYDFLTGCKLAREWQQRNGALSAGARLLPKRAFVLGGEYSVENLYSCDALKGMRFRGSIAVQLRDVPDGASVSISVVE